MLEQQSPLRRPAQTRKCKLQHPDSRVDLLTFSNS